MGDFNCTKYPVAITPHCCEECGRTIGRRERYSRTAAVWEGDWFTNVACLHCAIARAIVDDADNYYNECYYSGLTEWLMDSAEDVWSLRLKVGVSRKWQRFDGNGLMALPRNPHPTAEWLTKRIAEMTRGLPS